MDKEALSIIFGVVKNMLCEATILELPDVNKDIILCCDVSDYGIGCVINQITHGHEI